MANESAAPGSAPTLCAQLLAVSVAPGRQGPLALGESLAPASAVSLPLADGLAWAAAVDMSTAWPAARPPASAPVVLALSRGIRDQDGAPLDAAELARRLRTGLDLELIGPPFAAAVVGADVLVAADHLGLRHVYAVQGSGWAAIATSSMLLARLAEAELDPVALGAFRYTGQYHGLLTPFAGVTKLAPGCRWRLADGRVTSLANTPADDPDAMTTWSPPVSARLLRGLVEPFLDRYPEAVFELSGGMDSRMALAALPAAKRVGVRAFTLAEPDSADARVAAEIAAMNQLRHQVVDLSGLAGLDPAEAHRRVLDAAVRHDCSGNPVTLAAYEWAEEKVEPGVRITGQAGEMIRGLYFLEPRSRHVTVAHADRFTRWWFTRNEAIPSGCLAPDFAALSRLALRDQIRAVFAGYEMEWRAARDQFLLRERVHRWAGITYTGACLSRIISSPFFDIRFLRMCWAIPPAVKVSSGYAARMLEVLDSDLARTPLTSGLRPTSFPRTLGLYRPGKVLSAISRKVVQQVRPVNRPPAGASVLAAKVVDHWRANPHLLAETAKSGFLREDWLAALPDGGQRVPAATVGLLANLQAAGAAGITARWPH